MAPFNVLYVTALFYKGRSHRSQIKNWFCIMWKLIYEDTFGFGEDRDPPTIEKTGSDGRDGFFELWTNVLNEGFGISGGRPAVGFARFTLLTDFPGEKERYISIDVREHLDRLAGLKKDADPEKIRKISSEHYEACLKNQEESFWNNFSKQKKSLKVFAVNIGKNVYTRRLILTSLLIVLANSLSLFCLWSMFYLYSAQKTAEAIVAGVFALVFLLVNAAFLSIKALHMRYKYPERFYIEIDGKSFIHSDGNFVRKIDLGSIKKISEQEILSRGGLRVLIVVDYSDGGKETSYSFFKAFSKNDIVYEVSAEKLDALCR